MSDGSSLVFHTKLNNKGTNGKACKLILQFPSVCSLQSGEGNLKKIHVTYRTKTEVRPTEHQLHSSCHKNFHGSTGLVPANSSQMSPLSLASSKKTDGKKTIWRKTVPISDISRVKHPGLCHSVPSLHSEEVYRKYLTTSDLLLIFRSLWSFHCNNILGQSSCSLSPLSHWHFVNPASPQPPLWPMATPHFLRCVLWCWISVEINTLQVVTWMYTQNSEYVDN